MPPQCGPNRGQVGSPLTSPCKRIQGGINTKLSDRGRIRVVSFSRYLFFANDLAKNQPLIIIEEHVMEATQFAVLAA